MNSANLHVAQRDARDTLAALREALLYNDEEAIDDHVLKNDTLEGETDVFEMIDKALDDEMMCKAHAESIASSIKRLQERKKRLEDRAANLRTALAVTMEAIEEKKNSAPNRYGIVAQGTDGC